MKTYTLGEIFRLGLLKNHKGEPYRQKATLSRIVDRMGLEKVQTPFGLGYSVPESRIKEHNALYR
jgi:hypothetical protein